MEKDTESIKKSFTKADEQLRQAETDIEILQEFLKRYKNVKGNIRSLESFYFSEDYREGLEVLEEEGSTNDFWSTGQDAIWNISMHYRSLIAELLKHVSDDIYESTTRIEG